MTGQKALPQRKLMNGRIHHLLIEDESLFQEYRKKVEQEFWSWEVAT